MPNKKNEGMPEEPKYAESFKPAGEDNLPLPESEKYSESNPDRIQAESDHAEDKQNQPTAGGGPKTEKQAQSNLLLKLITSAAVVAGAVLLVVNLVANRIPKSELQDFYVGCDYIEYCFTITDIEDYELTLQVYNDYFSQTIEVHEGENSGTLTGLSPSTAYVFKVSGNCGFGKTSLISKSVTTAGNEPVADITESDYTLTDNGQISLRSRICFSDPQNLISACQLVWLYQDGTASGSAEIEKKNQDFVISDFRGTGDVTLYLYGTVNGVRTLYSQSSLHVSAQPQISWQAVNVAQGVDLRLSVFPMGSELTSVRIYIDGYDYDRVIPPESYASFSHLFTDFDEKKTYVLHCLYSYQLDQVSYTEEVTKTIVPVVCDVNCQLTSFTDGGTYFNMTFAYEDKSGMVTRVDLLLSDGTATQTLTDVDLGRIVSVGSLKPGNRYACSLRFYVGDSFTEQQIGTFDADCQTAVEASLAAGAGEMVCRLHVVDPYGYYSHFTVVLIAPNGTEIPFSYQEEREVWTAPAEAVDLQQRYRLLVRADSRKPSDMVVYGAVNVRLFEETVIY